MIDIDNLSEQELRDLNKSIKQKINDIWMHNSIEWNIEQLNKILKVLTNMDVDSDYYENKLYPVLESSITRILDAFNPLIRKQKYEEVLEIIDECKADKEE